MNQRPEEKQPFKHAIIKGVDLNAELQRWQDENPKKMILQSEVVVNIGEDTKDIMTLIYVDLDETEKDVEEEFRTPIVRFHYVAISELVSDGCKESALNDWYNENDIDIVSKKSIIADNDYVITGLVYVERSQAKEVEVKQKEIQRELIKRRTEELAKQELAKEAEKIEE